MQTASPALVIADTPYLAIEAGSRAQIPTVALASFTWDIVLNGVLQRHRQFTPAVDSVHP